MAKMDDFLKNLQQMDPAQLQALVQKATAGLSSQQQQSLKKLLSSPDALERLKGQITDTDLQNLEQNISSPQALENYMKQKNVQKRLDEIL